MKMARGALHDMSEVHQPSFHLPANTLWLGAQGFGHAATRPWGVPMTPVSQPCDPRSCERFPSPIQRYNRDYRDREVAILLHLRKQSRLRISQQAASGAPIRSGLDSRLEYS